MNILITGAASGLGHAAATLFSRNGDTVYALDISPIPAQERLIPFQSDITDESSLQAVYSQLEADGVQLDAIINFAGMIFIDNFLEVDEFCEGVACRYHPLEEPRYFWLPSWLV